MKTVLVGTRNDNKKKELKKMLKGLKVRVLTLSDLDVDIPPVVEDGKTFRQNAIKKALMFSRYVKGLVLADDSGLMVDALEGKPGVRSARFARTKADDAENNAKLLRFMENVPAQKRRATFVCAAALAENGLLIGTTEGQCVGSIGFDLRGENGFGYDPVFLPKGKDKTFAEMAARDKNVISHRALALKKLKQSIGKYLRTA